LREGEAKVAPSKFGDFLWEKGGLQKRLATQQKTPKLLGLPCADRRLFLISKAASAPSNSKKAGTPKIIENIKF
jgi:hypothetical protein